MFQKVLLWRDHDFSFSCAHSFIHFVYLFTRYFFLFILWPYHSSRILQYGSKSVMTQLCRPVHLNYIFALIIALINLRVVCVGKRYLHSSAAKHINCVDSIVLREHHIKLVSNEQTHKIIWKLLKLTAIVSNRYIYYDLWIRFDVTIENWNQISILSNRLEIIFYIIQIVILPF